MGSLVCLATSVMYHGTRLPTWRRVDMVVVNSIGSYYTICCLQDHGLQKTLAIWAYVLASGSLCIYAYQQRQSALYGEKHHWLIHVMSNAGLCCYVLATKH